MAWAWGDTFDCYAAVADALNGYWDSGNAGTVTLQPGRFSGSQALNFSSGATTTITLIKSSGANDALHHITCAFWQSAALSGTTAGLSFQLQDGTTNQCSVVFRSDGAILLTSGSPIGTTLATYAGAVTATSTWFAFEIEVLISGTAGYMNVRKNGNTVNDFASVTSLNTRSTANNYANRLAVVMYNAVSAQRLDDLYWRSDATALSWYGDMRGYTRAPASDAAVQFSRTPTGVLTQTVPTSAPSPLILAAVSSVYTAFVAGYSGTVTATAVAVNAIGGATNMKCAIFADNGSGSPGAILASATAPFTPVVAGTNSFTFSPGVSVVKGTTYWIGMITDGATTNYAASSTNTLPSTAAMAYSAFPQASPVLTTNRTAQMSWTYTATPANWQAVAEAQQDATTSYVYDSVPGHADLYGIAPIASTPLTTYAVTTRAYMLKSDAGTRTAAVQLKSGSSTVASPTVVLTTSSWQWAWRHDTLDPQTGAAWTAAAVNVAQVGPVVIA